MPLALTFLGTSASRPTIERGVSSIALVREGETMLIDCGEGTQRQMMRYGVSFSVGDIFFTHFHTDHFLGLLGLLRTLTLGARTEPLRLWGPKGIQAMMKRADGLGVERLSFPLEVTEITPGTPYKHMSPKSGPPLPIPSEDGICCGCNCTKLKSGTGKFHFCKKEPATYSLNNLSAELKVLLYLQT